MLVVWAAMLATGAQAQETPAFRCSAGVVAGIDEVFSNGRNFNREKVGQSYPVFAAASYDVYVDQATGQRRRFVVADNDSAVRGNFGQTGWQFVERYDDNNRSGLVYDVYYKDEGNRVLYLVAYRGTEGVRDWIANFSWLTQWFNVNDQYRLARVRFASIVAAAHRHSGGRPLAFITTGHSLGGGLAQHIAGRYPCVSAVVFNSSFVTNDLLFGGIKPTVVQIYEDNDVFSFLSSKSDNQGPVLRYRMNASTRGEFQHSMERLAAGIMRTTLACRLRSDCEVRGSIDLAATLYCRRYLSLRQRTDTVCRAR
ncbi:lipase family protein [Phreatobacter cathodiphilus]|uniref:lipase family protein n=1 Tax=Phreatobacter cathodiphilus TaxID=1868589 RepID=UPI0011B1E663|nr:lipase family protein [Phreatobacter cathodiphilus]